MFQWQFATTSNQALIESPDHGTAARGTSVVWLAALHKDGGVWDLIVLPNTFDDGYMHGNLVANSGEVNLSVVTILITGHRATSYMISSGSLALLREVPQATVHRRLGTHFHGKRSLTADGREYRRMIADPNKLAFPTHFPENEDSPHFPIFDFELHVESVKLVRWCRFDVRHSFQTGNPLQKAALKFSRSQAARASE